MNEQEKAMAEPDWTPLQAATRLKVSTTTLRRYEQLELIPEVPRKGLNRRVYREAHIRAFEALRALLQGCSVQTAYDVMKRVRSGDNVGAFWLINEQQAAVQEEKRRVTEMMQLLAQADFSRYNGRRVSEQMTIRDVAEMAGVKASAIRHWEAEGLISPARDLQSGYRIFGARELRRIVVISSLRRTVYFIENMKKLLEDLDTHNLAAVEKSFRIALEKLDRRLELQYRGIAAVVVYTETLDKERHKTL